MGDMRELPGLLAVVGFRFDNTIETQNNATMDEGKRSWFPRDKRLLSNRMIDVLCEYLLLDYDLFVHALGLIRARGRTCPRATGASDDIHTCARSTSHYLIIINPN